MGGGKHAVLCRKKGSGKQGPDTLGVTTHRQLDMKSPINTLRSIHKLLLVDLKWEMLVS